MPYSNKQMLRDANGDLIPQYWDVAEQDFKPLTGQGGANDVRLTGSIVELYHETGINITVTPGSSVVLVEGENFKDVKEIRGVLRWAFQSNNNWSLRIVYLRFPGSPMLITKQQSIHFDSHEAIIESMPVFSTRWNIEVANMDSSDYLFQRGTLIGLR